MPESLELRDFACPSCGQRMRLDVRFVQWCVECGHGADPKPLELDARSGRRAEREQARSLRLFESLRSAPNLRPTSASGVAVTAISTVVHVIGLAVLVIPIWLVVATNGFYLSDIALLIGGVTFWAVLPRKAFRGPDAEGMGRDQAPNLYALLDQCSAQLGCAVPAKVFVGGRYNASTGRIILRRESYLAIGMPLWTILSGQERIALLGHELGHQVNGDPAHGTWAGTARWSLGQWMRVLSPRQNTYEVGRSTYARRTHGMGGLAALLAPVVQMIVFLPFYLLALGCNTLLTRLDLYCGQRAEYLADELGARLAGSEAAGGLLGKLAFGEAIGTFILARRNRKRSTGRRTPVDEGDLWQSLAEFVDSIPETERQRRRILDKARNTRTDRTHPANHLRSALVHERPQWAGTIKLSEDEWARIDEELAPAGRAVAKRLMAPVVR